MKEYERIYTTHFGDSYSNGEIPVQDIRINGKSLGRKGTRVILNEEMEPCEREGISRLKRSIDIIIEKPKEDKKKKEEELKNWKNTMKKELLFTIGKLFKSIALSVNELEIQGFIKHISVLFPMETEKTYGITVDKEKKQALMINSLFEYFEEIDKLKGKDIPRVQKMIKEIQENARAFKAEVKAPPIMGEKVQACTKVKEDTKTIADLLQEDLEKRCKDRFKHEEKSRNSGKTQEMKDYVFFGIDFAKGKGKTQAFNVGFKNGKIVIQEI